jgi:uncharacterized protein
MTASAEQFAATSVDPAVRGFLHRAPGGRTGLVLTHGTGGNCNTPMLVALAEALAEAGITVLRCNLPFRQARSFGSPRPGEAEKDRQGLANAVAQLRNLGMTKLLMGGQSYGGRQASMLAADDTKLVHGLLLLSYPLHPPGKPQQRTEHFPGITTPTLFIHGCKDPFASDDEIETAVKLIPARTRIIHSKNGGHDLGFSGKKKNEELIPQIVEGVEEFLLKARS